MKKYKLMKCIIAMLLCILMLFAYCTSVFALTYNLTFTNKNSSKVSAILSSSSNTTLVISKLQCYQKNSSTGKYSTVKASNSTGNGTSIYAGVTPSSNCSLVKSAEYDFISYSVASTYYHTDYYWK